MNLTDQEKLEYAKYLPKWERMFNELVEILDPICAETEVRKNFRRNKERAFGYAQFNIIQKYNFTKDEKYPKWIVCFISILTFGLLAGMYLSIGYLWDLDSRANRKPQPAFEPGCNLMINDPTIQPIDKPN